MNEPTSLDTKYAQGGDRIWAALVMHKKMRSSMVMLNPTTYHEQDQADGLCQGGPVGAAVAVVGCAVQGVQPSRPL